MNEENKKEEELCPYNDCDGSGKVTVGEFDDLEEKDCLCAIEKKQDDMDDDS